ncbi:regulatory LuxR family protein [Kribbella sp. VKM Ac-2571]|uniref:AAA family ATPase n=1 Tax=Kribbella sp. VKM Ac-2571 TaxID=2512222 RepID=UPI00105E2BDA|nr:LuxR family transcriptional regulator [Kribbella sp. VKM Ac-2571]TDO68383.1 regulatory LuxR family protein [Kribbella sp. VKM Ac-2571]
MQHQPLVDRRTERAALDRMVAAVRDGESRVLVVQGAPGVGKSALIGYAEQAATGLQVLHAGGIESEMELAFAALHQLCLPLLDRLAVVLGPRREALETVFRLRAGTPPDPFLVGLGVLDLLSDASERQPLLCVIDDAQWLDRASAQVLGFVARRLLAESIGMLFGIREHSPELRGLATLEVTGLREADAHALLNSLTHARLDQRIRDQIVAETNGNPLALIELPRGLTPTQMAGGLGLLNADMVPGRIEQSFVSRMRDLPEPARLLLLVAAAEPAGDTDAVLRAAELLGIDLAAAAGTDGLMTIGERVTFRHPLVRSAVYRAAGAAQRRTVHRTLAEVTDPRVASDQRAWHLAAAAAGPDETVAVELERSAGRAQARGGVAAAAAFLQRAVSLTSDPARRVDRMLAAAEASLDAGAVEDVRRLLGALPGSLDAHQSGRAAVLEGQLAFASGAGTAAIPLLLNAAARFAATHQQLARETLLNAWGMATVISNRESFVAVARAVHSVPASGERGALDLVLDGVALLVTEGWAAAAETLRDAAKLIGDLPVSAVVRWGWQSTVVFGGIWDLEALQAVCTQQVGLVREAGALQVLPNNLAGLAYALTWAGEFEQAAAAIAEGELVAAATGNPIPPFNSLHLLSLQGRERETTELIAAALEAAAVTGFGAALTTAHWAGSVLYNGLGRYPEAMSSALAAEQTWEPVGTAWVLPELIEAACRSGAEQVARDALERLIEATRPFDADFPAGLEARNRALLARDDDAEALYREAIERLSRTRMRPDQARTHLLYGEWLRRRGQRVEARRQLRTAYDMFVAIGMEAFAERARRELLASGETVRKRAAEATSGNVLTAQERQIALLVRDGLSNPEVGARLFISPRTVEWHLRKIFAKLSIGSRRQLRDVLPIAGDNIIR